MSLLSDTNHLAEELTASVSHGFYLAAQESIHHLLKQVNKGHEALLAEALQACHEAANVKVTELESTLAAKDAHVRPQYLYYETSHPSIPVDQPPRSRSCSAHSYRTNSICQFADDSLKPFWFDALYPSLARLFSEL